MKGPASVDCAGRAGCDWRFAGVFFSAAVGPDRVGPVIGHLLAQGAEDETTEQRDDHEGKQGESYGHHICPFVATIVDAETMTNPE